MERAMKDAEVVAPAPVLSMIEVPLGPGAPPAPVPLGETLPVKLPVDEPPPVKVPFEAPLEVPLGVPLEVPLLEPDEVGKSFFSLGQEMSKRGVVERSLVMANLTSFSGLASRRVYQKTFFLPNSAQPTSFQ
jgi:hypothetical protein